jgi:glycogenin glucosyltransferase
MKSTTFGDSQMKRHAYVTVVCGGDAYVPGAEVLGRSLFSTGTSIRRLALVSADVGAEARLRLARQGWELLEIEEIPSPSPATAQLYPRFARTFSKLRAFGLSGLDKIALLDSDTVVLRNVDDLFERPSIAAAPDFFLPDRFNSGVLVVDPSPALFEEVYARLAQLGSYDGGDQGFLNEYFSGWYAAPVAHRLPAGYNMHHFIFQFMLSHASLRDRVLEEAKIIHFTLQKPWMGRMSSGGSELWWNMFREAHPERSASVRDYLHRLEDWSFERAVHLLEK